MIGRGRPPPSSRWAMPRGRTQPAPTTVAAPSRRRRRNPEPHKMLLGRGPTEPAPPKPTPPGGGRACAIKIAAGGPATGARTSRTARLGSQRRQAPDPGAGYRRRRRRHSRGYCGPRNQSPCRAKGPADHRKIAQPQRAVRPAIAQNPRSRRRAASASRAPPSRRASGASEYPPKNSSIWPCFPRCRPSPQNPCGPQRTKPPLYDIAVRCETARCRRPVQPQSCRAAGASGQCGRQRYIFWR